MSLVPIIYTSLIIFSTLLMFIIILSYISFKTRSGRGPRPNINEMEYGYLPQHVLVKASPERIVPIKPQVQAVSLNYVTRPITISNTHREIEHKIGHDNLTQRSLRNSVSRPKKYSNQNRVTRQSDRIEIMNNTERFRRTSEFDNVTLQPSGSISDSKLFSYYSDHSDIDFTVMNANYLRKAL